MNESVVQMKVTPNGGEHYMNIFLYASIGIAALALLMIAIVLVMTFKTVKQTMTDVQSTVGRVETKVNTITSQANGLLEKTNAIADDADQKLQAFGHLVETAKNLEETTKQLDTSFKNIAGQVANPPEKQRKIMEQASIVTETLSRIYYGFKNNRPKQQRAQQSSKQKNLPEPQKKLEFHE